MVVPICTTRNNGIAYLFWSWILRNNGAFVAWLDGSYLGPSRGMNDYDSLASSYKGSDAKPDKQYSILPTVLGLAGDLKGKTALDVGCGSGFFTLHLAQGGASMVCGVDNSPMQIHLAKEGSSHPAIKYCVGDIFTQHCDPVDIVVAPFVANYARTIPVLKHFCELVFRSVAEGGKAVFVIDLPNGKSLKRFGAVKTLLGQPSDEARIQIELFNEERSICTLFGVYYTPQTIEVLLREAGFQQVSWHTPIVCNEGVQRFGADFWKGYVDNPELGYLVAYK